MGCTAACKVVPGWACTTSGTDPDFISTCVPTCGNDKVGIAPAAEACDVGNSEHQSVVYDIATKGLKITANPAYDSNIPSAGCSADCLTVTSGYICPAPGSNSGPCSKTCGINALYEGVLLPFRKTATTDPAEECDDGNNVDGDGCSRMCKLEDGMLDGPKFKCEHVFKGSLRYELPEFITKCVAKSRRRLGDENDVLYLEDGHFISGQRNEDVSSHIILKQEMSLID